jgi:hypothetical protein
MTEEELDLLKLAARFMAQTGTCAAKIMRSYIFQATFRAPGFHHTPDDLRTESGFRNPLGFIDSPKYGPCDNTGGAQPVVDGGFYPGGNWNCPDMATLSHQISYYPVLLPLLQTLDRQQCRLRPSEATAQEYCDHGIVAFAT